MAVTSPQKPTAKPAAPVVADVATLITQNIGVINRIMPKYLNAERMIQLAISYSRKPELRDCTPASFVGVFMAAAQLGLELDVRGEAYAVPFWNKKCNPPRKEAQFIAGYKGLIKLATNSGKVRNVFAHEVRQGDEFDYGYGLEPYLHHKPGTKRGDVTHVYAVGAFTNGGHHFEVMSVDEVEANRDKFSKAAKSGPWVDNPREMYLKTVCRRLCKFLPASTDLSRAVALDEAQEAQIPQDLGLNMLGMDGVMDADYSADADAEDMERVKEEVRNGGPSSNGNRPDKAPAPAPAPAPKPAAPAKKEESASEPAQTSEPTGAAQEDEGTMPPDHATADQEIVFHDFRDRIRAATTKDAAVDVYSEALRDSALGGDHMAKLQTELKNRLRTLQGR